MRRAEHSSHLEHAVSHEVVGLVPAAGRAQRVPFLPCSKELFPVDFQAVEEEAFAPKPVCLHLLEAMRVAGAQKTFLVLRDGKWDIPAYLRDGSAVGMPLAYLMMHLPYGVPFTADQAYPFLGEALVLFGFPDILFRPGDAFLRLRERQRETAADVVLGLFPAPEPNKADLVAFGDDGRVRAVVTRPPRSDLQYAWMIALWRPLFSHFMHDYLRTLPTAWQAQFEAGQRELIMGDVLRAALEEGLRVEAVPFAEGAYLDIGTPEDLARAVRGAW